MHAVHDVLATCAGTLSMRLNWPGTMAFLVFLHVGETSEKAVGPALEDINPALNPKNSDQVDELLAAEISLYVQLHA